jgi:hypothetical protein
MTLDTLILTVVWLINLGLLFFILFNKNKQRRWPIFFLVFLVLLWQSSELINILFLLHSRYLLLGVRAGMLPTLYIAPIFVWLSYSLVDGWKNIRKWQQLFFLPAYIMSPFALTKYNASGLVVGQNSVSYVPGPIYFYFAVYFIILMSWGLVVLIRERSHYDQVVKKQIDYIFVATALTALLALLFIFVLPLLGVTAFYYMGVNSSVIFTAIVTYALFRYRFLDLKISFYKVLVNFVRLLLTGLVYAVLYVLLIGPVQVDFSHTINSIVFLVFFGLTSPIVFGIASSAAKFFIYHPLERIIQAENNIAVILRSSRDLNRLMSSLSKEIAQVIDYKEIFIYLAKRGDANFFHQVYPVGERTLHMDHDLILQKLAKQQDLLHSPEVHYLGLDPKLSQELNDHHIDISFPIYYNNQLLGVLMLDNNKKLLYQQQLDFLKEVNKYLDIAIGSLLLYQQAMANKEEK